MTREPDYFRAFVIGDSDKGEQNVGGDVFVEEGDAFRQAAAVKEEYEVMEVVIQRSTNGPDGPWRRY